ncbi:hypothetical protein [Synechocystis sp. PCC 7338]|uniref:hypothetical protein n=1 Tax=Synechocystis sp. PCC 7338 TaxID=2732530 RepID=UPI001BAFEF6D|nr:hypothetical protein [Synechocystis sp. PCC 7338]QUS61724.1 hypothetical protein HTZ78_14345 [Synechocystis sp. PCC 7338]
MDSLINIVISQKTQFKYASKLLTKLSSDEAINLFCQKWAETRNEQLTKILVQAGYVATRPDNIRVLTFLKVNKIEENIQKNPQLIKLILDLFDDQDREIAQRARNISIALFNQKIIDYLFYLYIVENNQVAYQCIQKANYQSSNIEYRTLFHFLREEWDKYNQIDFDKSILETVYLSSELLVRKNIVRKARKLGWVEVLNFISKDKDRMVINEWHATLNHLKDNRQFSEMLQLVYQAPAWVSYLVFICFKENNWQPTKNGLKILTNLQFMNLSEQAMKISIKSFDINQIPFICIGTYNKVVTTNEKLVYQIPVSFKKMELLHLRSTKDVWDKNKDSQTSIYTASIIDEVSIETKKITHYDYEYDYGGYYIKSSRTSKVTMLVQKNLTDKKNEETRTSVNLKYGFENLHFFWSENQRLLILIDTVLSIYNVDTKQYLKYNKKIDIVNNVWSIRVCQNFIILFCHYLDQGHYLDVTFLNIENNKICHTEKIEIDIDLNFNVDGISDDSRLIIFKNNETREKITLNIDSMLCPINKINPSKADVIKRHLNSGMYTSNEKEWLNFIYSLLVLNSSFDIEIESDLYEFNSDETFNIEIE